MARCIWRTLSASWTSATNSCTGGGFSGIETLNTGAGPDVITLTMAPTDMTDANLINLGAGTDTINAQFAADWLINASNGGFIRDAANNLARVAFAGVENLTSTGNSIIDMPGAGVSIAGTFTAPQVTFAQNGNNAGFAGLRITAPGGINGPAAGPLTLAAGAMGIDINGPLTVNGAFTSALGGGGIGRYRDVTSTGFNQTYFQGTQLRGDLVGADLTFNGITDISGNVLLSSSTDIFDFNAPVTSNPATAGTDVLNIVPTISRDIFIDLIDGPGHVAANRFNGFNGFLSIGGEFIPAATGAPVFDGDLISGTADQITIKEPLETNSGNVILYGSNIVFDPTNVFTDIVVGKNAPPVNGGIGEVALIAIGDQLQPTNDGFGGLGATGLIMAPAADEVTVRGGSALLAATDALENSENIILALGGGPILVTQGPNAPSNVSFNVQSSANPNSGIVPDSLNILQSVAGLVAIAQGIGVSSFSGVTGAQQSIVTIFNPAAVLTLLQAVSFLDASAFEEHLSLFGIIGEGIAQSLDQCEEAEGCAPSVTEEELDGFIAVLNDRISRLEGLLAAGEIDTEEGQRLLAQYRLELQAFLDYRTELQAYLARQEADEFGDDFGDEFDDVFEAEEVLVPVQEEVVEEEPVEEIEEVLEDEIPADTFEDIEEAVETFEELPIEEPVAPDTSDEPDFETLDDDFEELEEEIDDSLIIDYSPINDIMNSNNVNQLAGAIRVDRRGQVIWGGDIVLPTLHRRF